MPNGLQRSISAFFNRNGKDRSSGRRKKEDKHDINRIVSPRLPRNETFQNNISFNDDYVDPIDIVNPNQCQSNYDSPWDSNNPGMMNIEPLRSQPLAQRIPNACNYDEPWGDHFIDTHVALTKQQVYDDPWDRNDRTTVSGTSGTMSTMSSHSSGQSNRSQQRVLYRPPQIHQRGRGQSFQPDPRLVEDPTFTNQLHQPIQHQRSYSNQNQIPSIHQTRNVNPHSAKLRPARSHESLKTEVLYDHIPTTCTPSIAESPLSFHKRQSSQPVEQQVGSSAYLQQLLRQTDDSISTSLDDLLYGQRKVLQPPIPMERSRSTRAPSGVRKNHSLSPQRPVMQSTMLRNLQQFDEHDIYAVDPVIKCTTPHQTAHSSSTGRSSASDRSQSSGNQSSRANQAEILDSMDYYRSTMTRHESEKVLDNEQEGSFLVRRNTQNPGWYSISVVTGDQGVLHLVIQRSEVGWHIGGGGVIQAEFPSVPDLISYYQEHSLNIRGTKGLKLLLKYR